MQFLQLLESSSSISAHVLPTLGSTNSTDSVNSKTIGVTNRISGTVSFCVTSLGRSLEGPEPTPPPQALPSQCLSEARAAARLEVPAPRPPLLSSRRHSVTWSQPSHLAPEEPPLLPHATRSWSHLWGPDRHGGRAILAASWVRGTPWSRSD